MARDLRPHRFPRWSARYEYPFTGQSYYLWCRTGYGQLIRNYVSFILAKLRFHRHRPEFNGLFEYEEYISLKNIDDPNEG